MYLGLGSNLGDRKQNLLQAESLLNLLIVEASSFYDTEPVDFLEQPWFLNRVLKIETDLPPRKLLQRCQQVEIKMGRKREIPKGPRIIDIDILFYGDLIVNEPDLIIPHPGIPERKFVLDPMNEIAQGFIHPQLQQPIHEILQSCPDNSVVIRRADLA
ncbi:MAG: 2-amino-4-hydroxy-6-hydroxymethyldihydropteridine diphosphokinase [Acidobacteria bacterium]|nr:MAG: 2-amino-4-hydroxy-6-hydroxymethyldihydropteridine diphosphokinase [Acidobacteriota bacterium]